MEIELRDLAEKLGAEIVNPPQGESTISGLAALADAGPGDLSFYHHQNYLNDLKGTSASAVLVPRRYAEEVTHVPLLVVESASLAFDEATRFLLGAPLAAPEPGIHPSAVIHESVQLDPLAVSIGPCVVVERGVRIGAGSSLRAGVTIGPDCSIGAGCTFHPKVTLYDRTQVGDQVTIHSGSVIGADGFGYELRDGRHRKIEHFGNVVLEDEVEIGANSSIDRGRFGSTRIGEGTKIDNMVQIGHNATIGRHSVIVAVTGIAGSTHIGDHVTIAAQVGMTGHLKVGSYSVLAARTGVTKSLPGGTPEAPAFYAGFPAGPAAKIRKEMVAPRKVPEILRRLRALEEQLEALRSERRSK